MNEVAEQGLAAEDSPEAIARDVASVGRIGAVPSILQIICRNTGMGFAAVARVTDGTWTACAVYDAIGFGLKPGGQLELRTTLCTEVRSARQPIVFDEASSHPVYKDHHTPRMYGLQSYVSVPIVLGGGEYFGNLCAIDPRPAAVSKAEVIESFLCFAQLIAAEIERERREEELRAELSRAQESALLRDQFIAILGHDLRNPLQTVMNTADLMTVRPGAIDVAATGKRLKTSAVRMSKLISDILDFARVRLGSGMTLQKQADAGLAAALAEVVHEAQVAHPERVFVERIDVPGEVHYDKGRLQQLLSNLVGNAVHHGDPASPVEVTASVADGELRVTVSNMGPVIEADHLDKIFEPYWRPPTSRTGGGLGLGLHICSQIAQAHAGRMHVESSGGKTSFSAHIPIGEV